MTEQLKNVTSIDTELSTIVLDEDGILLFISKPNVQQTQSIEKARADMAVIRKLANGKKVCMIYVSVKHTPSPSKEVRDLVSKELNDLLKAMAVVVSSPVSNMIANLFFALSPPSYPVKLVKDMEEARAWIKQHS